MTEYIHTDLGPYSGGSIFVVNLTKWGNLTIFPSMLYLPGIQERETDNLTTCAVGKRVVNLPLPPPTGNVNQARRIDFCQRDFRLNTEFIDASTLSLLFFTDVYTNSTQKQHYFELRTAFFTLKGQGIDRCCWVYTVSLPTVVCRLRQEGDATLGLAINNKHAGRVRSHFSVMKRCVSACCYSRTIEFH